MITLLFIGTSELLLIAGVALLFFGGKKLPEMMRGLGQGIKQFKDGMKDVTEPIEETLNQDMSDDNGNLTAHTGKAKSVTNSESKAEEVNEKKK